MTTLSYPMPHTLRSLQDLYARLARGVRSTYRDPLWENMHLHDRVLTLYAFWESPDDHNIPFQVHISYEDNMLHYTPDVPHIHDLQEFILEYVRDYFIPRIHPTH